MMGIDPKTIPNFHSIRLAFDPSMPVDAQYHATLYLWDWDKKIGTMYVSWRKTEGVGRQFQTEGQETPEEAIAVVLSKWRDDQPDKVTTFGD